MKRILFVVLLLTAVTPAQAQINSFYYISPGIQIGYSNDHGWFFSTQVSAGIVYDGFVPAVTIGKRRYRNRTMRYADVQLYIPFGGFGMGKIWVKSGDKPEQSNTMTGLRFKLYAGWWLFGTYDANKLSGHPIEHHLGMYLAFPIFNYLKIGTAIGN